MRTHFVNSDVIMIGIFSNGFLDFNVNDFAGKIGVNMSEVAIDSHLNARGFFSELTHPIVGKLTYPGRPFTMSETPFQMTRPAPLLGQHNQEVYEELGRSKEELAHMAEWGVI